MNTEKLNLWDRLFNRYKKIIVSEGIDRFYDIDVYGNKSFYYKRFVKYKIIDRLTDSETIKYEYVN